MTTGEGDFLAGRDRVRDGQADQAERGESVQNVKV